jgi:hypothetical protein
VEATATTMETATTAMKAAAATAAVKASSATTAVTAALAECCIWRESKNHESSERNEGSNQTKSVHNLSFPSSVVADFQLQISE